MAVPDRAPGMVSIFVLVVMVLTAKVMTTAFLAVSDHLQLQQFLHVSEAYADMLQQFCRANAPNPLLSNGTEINGPEVLLSQADGPVHLRITAKQDGCPYIRVEQAMVADNRRMPLVKARRCEITPPGGADHPVYSGGEASFPRYALVDFASCRSYAEPLPARWQGFFNLGGRFYDARARILRIRREQALAGSGLLLLPKGIVFSEGVRYEGRLICYSFGDIVIGRNVTLRGVFLFTDKRIIVGENSHIHGIMTAGTAISRGEGSSLTADRDVLKPFQTSYVTF
jgi:hypothetical protein